MGLVTRIGIQPGYAILAGLASLVFALIVYQSFQGTSRIVIPSAVPSASTTRTSAETAIAGNSNSELSLVGQASVIDGDTIEIHGTRIRFSGIDAPESRQTCEANGVSYLCGQKAALALSDFIGAHTVSCKKTGTDRWRRVIAKCFSDGTDLSGWMVSNGWAIAYRKYSMDYVADEDRARSQKVGIWAGTFMIPEEWRKSKQKGG
jgi:endonuclease YncB( thermonuclease family)